VRAHSLVLRLLEGYVAAKSPDSSVAYRVLVSSLLENYAREDVRDLVQVLLLQCALLWCGFVAVCWITCATSHGSLKFAVWCAHLWRCGVGASCCGVLLLRCVLVAVWSCCSVFLLQCALVAVCSCCSVFLLRCAPVAECSYCDALLSQHALAAVCFVAECSCCKVLCACDTARPCAAKGRSDATCAILCSCVARH